MIDDRDFGASDMCSGESLLGERLRFVGRHGGAIQMADDFILRESGGCKNDQQRGGERLQSHGHIVIVGAWIGDAFPGRAAICQNS